MFLTRICVRGHRVAGAVVWILKEMNMPIPENLTRSDGWDLIDSFTNIRVDRVKELFKEFGVPPSTVRSLYRGERSFFLNLSTTSCRFRSACSSLTTPCQSAHHVCCSQVVGKMDNAGVVKMLANLRGNAIPTISGTSTPAATPSTPPLSLTPPWQTSTATTSPSDGRSAPSSSGLTPAARALFPTNQEQVRFASG